VQLALGTVGVVLVVLVWELVRPLLIGALARTRERSALATKRRELVGVDRGRELRAERRAQALLRSCVPPEQWEMYRDLGFLRVCGAGAEGHAYLVYPHRPIVSYVPRTGALLSEHCISFPDESRPYGSDRLPDADDVLAKWIALSADEQGLIERANMHVAGRQVDADAVLGDIERLKRWERSRPIGDRLARGRAGIVRAA
jgi:hypothetical protein